jgi:uncharacterized protein DUF6188
MMRLEEQSGEFNLIFRDAQVIRVILDYRLGIIIQDYEDDRLEVVIENRFFARTEKDMPATKISPEESTTDLGTLAVSLRFQRLSQCHVAQRGTLTLGFESGLTLEIPPDPHYEAWDLDHRSFKLIATPGGELAVWDRGFRKQGKGK